MFLYLLVEFVAFLAVFLCEVDLLSGLRVEVVAFRCAFGGLLVQFVAPVTEFAGEFDKLSFRVAFEVVVGEFDVR